jgi:Raf kinase inhibitor-like YbhB/YbcL family protein
MGVKSSLREFAILFAGSLSYSSPEITISCREYGTKCLSMLQTARASLEEILSMRNLHLISIVLISTLFAYARPAQAQFMLTSPAIAPGAMIPSDYACTGSDKSPALAWSNAPQATKSFALIVQDPDAPGGTFIHWVAYNIPAQTTSLPAGVPKTAEINGGGKNGINSFGNVGYNGPCPPPGKVHHYHFLLYALDSTLNLPDKADAAAVEDAMTGHVLATAELVGTFER